MEQITSILTYALSAAMKEKTDAPENLKFSDVVTVTVDDILDYISRFGFDPKSVSCAPKEDRHCIIPNEFGGWTTFYLDRGHRRDERQHLTKESAERCIVETIMMSNKYAVNSRYRAAHPYENLPNPGDMD